MFFWITLVSGEVLFVANITCLFINQGNSKRAEWAFGNGVRQAELTVPRSKEQAKLIIQIELEFRLQRAR
jgi:hypothetical protein